MIRGVPLKRLATVVAGQSPPSADVVEFDGDGLPFLQGNAEFGHRSPHPRSRCDAAPKHAQRGDLLVSVRAPVGALNLADREYGIGRGLAAVRPGASLDPAFCWWWLHSAVSDLQAQATGSTYDAVTAEDVGALQVPSRAVDDQRAIAEFLDVETARIDALITKKRRMIEVLDRRAVVASDRLLLGLEHRDVLPARSPYFTDVPRHWKETSVRHLYCQVQTGPFGSQLHAEDYVEDGWPVVNPANLRGGEIVAIPGMSVSDEKRRQLDRHTLQEGDVVFGRRGEMGRAGLVEPRQVGWLCGTGSLRLRLSSHSPLEPAYLVLLLQTTALRHYFELASIGSTMDNLNSEIVLAMPCLVPPRREQLQLVKSVQSARAAVRSLSERLERQIVLLQEHRQALITAAVTGEMEVPGVAA